MCVERTQKPIVMPGCDDGKAENGAKLFKAKCATCHTCNEGGPNKQGPNLFGVIGRQSGQVRRPVAHLRAHARTQAAQNGLQGGPLLCCSAGACG